MHGANRAYRYLDGDLERQKLVDDIRRVRESVVQIVNSIPEERHYEPRYHGWTLAALLTHLHLIDMFSIWAIQLALLGIRPPVPLSVLSAINNVTARLFKKRITTATLRGIQARERRISELILTLPMDKFSKTVYDPTIEAYITVERALQVCFLFHWQEHLLTIQRVEGIFYEPPERFDTL
jgi:hypothetical protein